MLVLKYKNNNNNALGYSCEHCMYKYIIIRLHLIIHRYYFV